MVMQWMVYSPSLTMWNPALIDFNAGRQPGGESMESLTEELCTNLFSVTSGEARTNNENNDFWDIAMWKARVTT